VPNGSPSITLSETGTPNVPNTSLQMHLSSRAFVSLTLLIALTSGLQRQFHAYSFGRHKTPPSNCMKYIAAHKATNIQEKVAMYGLWPHVISNKQKITSDSFLFGIGEALDEIWRNQHPPDCSKAKYLIAGNHVGGFGSEMHVTGSILALALEMGRVYLQNPIVPDIMKWESDNQHCRSQNKTNLECYYEPWSSCTVLDALGPDAITILHRGPIRGIEWNDSPSTALHDPKFKKTFLNEYEQDQVVMMQSLAIGSSLLPSSFVPLLRCSPMKSTVFHYWWRAVSITYLMRPNSYALEWIEKNQLTHFNEHAEDAVGVYIRRGDKAIEMRLAGVDEYQSAIDLMWSGNYIQPFQSPHGQSSRNRPIFLASEDSKVLEEMIHWAKENRTEYTIALTNVFDRKGMYAEKSEEERKAGGPEVHHPDEYLSMMLNLHYLLRSTAWVCTLGSNYCRVVDELRATVAAKADHPFADLSVESCPNPPCIYQDLRTFYWRHR
jgi:hypothetical protein